MTQTASIDLGAMVANRQAQPARPATRPQSDFVSAYRQASDSQEPVKQREPDRSNATRPEREAPTESTNDREPVNETQQAEAQQPEAKLESPKSNDAQEAKSNAKSEAKAPESVAVGEPAPGTETAPEVEVPVQTPEEAQAMLALLLATGAQVNTTPVATATGAAEAAAAAEAQAVSQASAEQLSAAEAELLAEALKAQGKAQAAAHAQAGAHTEAPEHASENAKLPAFLAQAAQGLGNVKVQAEAQTAVPAEPAAEGMQNLSLQILDEAVLETTNTGSITQAALLDDAEGIETTSQFVTLLTDETEETLAPTEGEGDRVTVLNGERPINEGTKVAHANGKDFQTQAPAKAEDLTPQILKYADAIKANQQNSIKLQLYPEHLGKMEIKVTSHAGVISAQLTADSHQVKSMLESQVAMLQRSFAELGLKIDKVEVTLASSNMQFDAQNGSTAQGGFQQGQQQPQHDARSGLIPGSGYEQWLGNEPDEQMDYAELGTATGVNFVA